MSVYAWSVVLFLAAASLGGIISFLAQYRTRRTMAMIALVAAILATLVLSALALLGGSFALEAFIQRPLGGYPFPAGTTWVYSRVDYHQVIGDLTQIITATLTYTQTVVRIEGSGPSLEFVQEQTVSEVSAPPQWESWTILEPGQSRYRIEGNRILENRPPDDRDDIVLYDFPLAVDKRWCLQPLQPANESGCNEMGRREVQSKVAYATAVGTFDECYEILDPYYMGGTEWFCSGIGVVARKYDHSGTRFGFEDKLIHFLRSSPP